MRDLGDLGWDKGGAVRPVAPRMDAQESPPSHPGVMRGWKEKLEVSLHVSHTQLECATGIRVANIKVMIE